MCDRNKKCPKGFDCVPEDGKHVCRPKGAPPKKDLGAPDFPRDDMPWPDGPSPDSGLPDGPAPDKAAADKGTPDLPPADLAAPDYGVPLACRDKVLVSGVQTTADSFDLVAETTGVMRIYYIKGGTVLGLVQSGSSWTPLSSTIKASKLSATLDSADTTHMVLVDGASAKHAAKPKNKNWSPATVITVKDPKGGTTLAQLTPGGVDIDGAQPAFGVVDGQYGSAVSAASPFDVVPGARRGAAMEFKFPKLVQSAGVTYSGCQVATATSKRYLVCGTTVSSAGSSLELNLVGSPPSNLLTTTNINLVKQVSTPAVTTTGAGKKLEMIFLQDYTSSAVGGLLRHAQWTGSGSPTLSASNILKPERFKPGSMDLVRRSGGKLYVTAQSVTSGTLKLLIGGSPGAWSHKTISTNGGAESRIRSGATYLHTVHVDSKGNLRYSCLLP